MAVRVNLGMIQYVINSTVAEGHHRDSGAVVNNAVIAAVTDTQVGKINVRRHKR